MEFLKAKSCQITPMRRSYHSEKQNMVKCFPWENKGTRSQRPNITRQWTLTEKSSSTLRWAEMELMSIKQTKIKYMDIFEPKCFRIFFPMDMSWKIENSKFNTCIYWTKNFRVKVLLLSRLLVAQRAIRWQILFGCQPEFFKCSLKIKKTVYSQG